MASVSKIVLGLHGCRSGILGCREGAISIFLALSTLSAFIMATMESPSEASVPIMAEYFFAIIRAEPSAVTAPASGFKSPTLVFRAVALPSAAALSSPAW